MKIISYNVNGIRAALKKEWLNWIGSVSPDVICLQEIKAHPEQLELGVFEEAGYHHAWFPAVKKGYSGVAVLSKKRPDHIELGMGIEAYDDEGRVIRADFGDLSVMSAYFPSGTSGDERQANESDERVDDHGEADRRMSLGSRVTSCLGRRIPKRIRSRCVGGSARSSAYWARKPLNLRIDWRRFACWQRECNSGEFCIHR